MLTKEVIDSIHLKQLLLNAAILLHCAYEANWREAIECIFVVFQLLRPSCYLTVNYILRILINLMLVSMILAQDAVTKLFVQQLRQLLL